jgi:hypothetical protein
VVWVRAPPEEKTLLLLLSNRFTSKSDNGAMEYYISRYGFFFQQSESVLA